jgi:hypothetical protein
MSTKRLKYWSSFVAFFRFWNMVIRFPYYPAALITYCLDVWVGSNIFYCGSDSMKLTIKILIPNNIIMINTFTLLSKFLILQFQTMVGMSFKTNAIESSFSWKFLKTGIRNLGGKTSKNCLDGNTYNKRLARIPRCSLPCEQVVLSTFWGYTR